MTYKILKQGDVRKPGDQVRSRNLPGTHVKRERYDADAHYRVTDLIGHPILASDLCHLEFRRPCQSKNSSN